MLNPPLIYDVTCAKLIPDISTFISIEIFLSFDFSQPPHVLKTLLIVGATQF